MTESLRKAGSAVRREVLGSGYVEERAADVSAFDEPFMDMILDSAWGHVWAREGLSLRDRSLLTITLLAALGHWEELAMHVRATANTGASPEEVREAIMHVAVYAGVPAANHALKVAKAAYAELGVTV